MNITPENVLSAQHAEWLNHPVTKQMLTIMEQQTKAHAQNLSRLAFTGTPDDLRKYAIGINTLSSIKTWVTNTEQFVGLLG